MKHKLGMLLLGSALMAGPAAAQNAASLLQTADKAIGANAVNSVVYSGTGWMGAVGQSFATEGAGSDWPRTDFKSYVATIATPANPLKRSMSVFRATTHPAAAASFPFRAR